MEGRRTPTKQNKNNISGKKWEMRAKIITLSQDILNGREESICTFESG